MAAPPPVHPRTIFLKGSSQDLEKNNDSPTSLPTQGSTTPKINQIIRSQSLAPRRMPPPLPNCKSHSEPRYQDLDGPGSDSAYESISTDSRSSLYSKKRLPPLPRGTPVSEPLYEDLLNIQEDPDILRSAPVVPAQQPPPVPPKPKTPLQVPRYVIAASLDVRNDPNTHSTTAPSSSSGDSRLRLPPLLPPHMQNEQNDHSLMSHTEPECGEIPAYLEILPDETPENKEAYSTHLYKPLPPTPKARPHIFATKQNSQAPQTEQDSDHEPQETDYLTNWWNTVEPWEDIFSRTGSSEDEDRKILSMKVDRIQMGISFFNHCLNKHGEALQSHITNLNDIANKMDRSSKNVKIGTITGGTTGVLGGVATVAGIVLAPMTMGVSLAVTAVGVGAIAAGGVTGATVAITKKKSIISRRNKVEQIVQDYRDEVSNIDQSLEFIVSGAKELEKHDISILWHEGDSTMTKVMGAERVMKNASFLLVAARSTRILQEFALDEDSCISEDKSQKVTKESKDTLTYLSKGIRELAQCLQDSLNDLIEVKNVLALE